MNNISEARVDSNGKIFFNGGFRWIIGGLAGFFLLILLTLVTNVIANDNKYTNAITQNSIAIARMEASYDSIKSDLSDIKRILRKDTKNEN